MGTHYRPHEPEQAFLLPPSPRNWLPEDHLVYFISDTIDQPGLSGFHLRYQGGGRRLTSGGVLGQCGEHGEQAQRSNGGPITCFGRQAVRNAG